MVLRALSRCLSRCLSRFLLRASVTGFCNGFCHGFHTKTGRGVKTTPRGQKAAQSRSMNDWKCNATPNEVFGLNARGVCNALRAEKLPNLDY
ncbi:hypothetical protein GGS21DRAFT_204753 [Xylaria nigripes]|nr:hypothetical protein GGS21DRAFT_204753 [Xylaria nigripes]